MNTDTLALLETLGDCVNFDHIKRRFVTDRLVRNRAAHIKSLSGQGDGFILAELCRLGVTNRGIATRLSNRKPMTPAQMWSLMNDPIPSRLVEDAMRATMIGNR